MAYPSLSFFPSLSACCWLVPCTRHISCHVGQCSVMTVIIGLIDAHLLAVLAHFTALPAAFFFCPSFPLLFSHLSVRPHWEKSQSKKSSVFLQIEAHAKKSWLLFSCFLLFNFVSFFFFFFCALHITASIGLSLHNVSQFSCFSVSMSQCLVELAKMKGEGRGKREGKDEGTVGIHRRQMRSAYGKDRCSVLGSILKRRRTMFKDEEARGEKLGYRTTMGVKTCNTNGRWTNFPWQALLF